jgi:uncharacterized protein
MKPDWTRPLHIAITGATGLIGSELTLCARAAGHRVTELRRLPGGPQTESITGHWNPITGQLVAPGPVDVVVHLAGRNIATRWSARAKKEIWDSRVPATENLCGFLADQAPERRVKLLIAASAIGIYGSRGEELLTEDSPPAPSGASFLSDLTRAWEGATKPAQDVGIRVVHVRIGVVLAREGGALAKLALPTKLGLAGPVGPATQFIPWISATDLARLLLHLATSQTTVGVINAVAPPPGSPVRQHEFIRTLGKVLHRPTIFPLPAFMVKLAFGQMGAETLLASLRVVPTRLPVDFTFLHASLESALRAELASPLTPGR